MLMGGMSTTPRQSRKPRLQTPSIQSLDRGLFILEAVAKSSHPVSLNHLTELLGIDRSSVFRLTNTLRRRGFLANPRGRKEYVLGLSLWRLSRQYDWSDMLITSSHEHLKKLAAITGETTHLAIREGKEAFFVDYYSATRQLIMVTGQVGEFVPLYCTAHGKALLAGWSADDLKATFGAGPYQRFTASTITTLKQLAKECAHIEEVGYAVDEEEYVEGARCLAAPVRDRDGSIIAAVGISAPIARFPPERDATAGRQVCDVASEISAILSAEMA
jgi:IclR family transcriptional regulator, acetate operon repressor